MSVLRPGGFGRRLLPCFRGSFPRRRVRYPIGRKRLPHFGAMGTAAAATFSSNFWPTNGAQASPALTLSSGTDPSLPQATAPKPQAGAPR